MAHFVDRGMREAYRLARTALMTGKTIVAAALAGAWMMIASPVLAQDKEADTPRPTPIGNPGAWIPADGYPAAARASAEEGRVGFTLDVDDTGRVSDCKVTSSSGSPLLDETTCYFMSANGRFTRARDAKNKVVPGKWSSAMRWKLEAAPPPAATPAAPQPAPVARTK